VAQPFRLLWKLAQSSWWQPLRSKQQERQNNNDKRTLNARLISIVTLCLDSCYCVGNATKCSAGEQITRLILEKMNKVQVIEQHHRNRIITTSQVLLAGQYHDMKYIRRTYSTNTLQQRISATTDGVTIYNLLVLEVEVGAVLAAPSPQSSSSSSSSSTQLSVRLTAFAQPLFSFLRCLSSIAGRHVFDVFQRSRNSSMPDQYPTARPAAYAAPSAVVSKS
jgi:hypothetical protein